MTVDRFRDTIHDLHEDAVFHRDKAAEHLARADELDQQVADMEVIIHRTAPPEIAPDGSGSVPPLDDPDPSPTLPTFGVIVTLAEDLQAGSQLWVRRESWGELAVDERESRSASWTPGVFSELTVEDAP